uniref:Glutaredoxin-like protein n=1 Tax=Apteryx owenii TaxID=8824 RepID=A0A8B9SEW6_APTOW
MVLRFLSRTVQLARHSSSPLGRPLCSASANKPVLTLFTKKPCPLCDEAKEVLEPHKKRVMYYNTMYILYIERIVIRILSL